jgi:hypothetical protein
VTAPLRIGNVVPGTQVDAGTVLAVIEGEA